MIFNKKNLKRIKITLCLSILIFGLTIVFDAMRQPENQLTARVYIGFVHIYQSVGRPLLKGIVACRFRPTCSDYSIQAVKKHGIGRGLVLTFSRIYSCDNHIAMGTIDDVPD